jgi:hypothetical protein
MEVAEFTIKPVAGVAPKVTAVAPLKSLPEMVTEVPPPSGPAAGETEVTAGAAA